MSKYYEQRIETQVEFMLKQVKTLECNDFWIPGNKRNLKRIETIINKIDKMLETTDEERDKYDLAHK